MSGELARFVVQQVGIAKLRASEGLFYEVCSAYYLVPGDVAEQNYSYAGAYEWREGEAKPSDPTYVLDCPLNCTAWIVSHHALDRGSSPYTILGERKIEVYCEHPDLFYPVIDLGLREGYEVIQKWPDLPNLYFVYE